MTKLLEKAEACQLRSQGWSLKEIADKLHISKATASVWTANIERPPEMIEDLIKRTRLYGNKHTQKFFADKRQRVTDEAEAWLRQTQSPDHLIFAALYWGEGQKRRGGVDIGTSDPSMIKKFVTFLRQYCSISEDRLRGSLHIHPGCDVEQAVAFWESVSQIPRSQWTKHQIVIPVSSKQISKHKCPYGTFRASYHCTTLRAKTEGWMRAIGYVEPVV